MSLLWSVLFGSVGLVFFGYGKQQGTVVPLVCGLTLMVFPYFVSSTILLVILRDCALASKHAVDDAVVINVGTIPRWAR